MYEDLKEEELKILANKYRSEIGDKKIILNNIEEEIIGRKEREFDAIKLKEAIK